MTEQRCPGQREEMEVSGENCPLTGSAQCALQETRETVIRLEEKFDIQNQTLDELKREVWGNGKPGLKTELIRLRVVMKAMIWVLAIVGGAIILDATSRMIQHIAPKNEPAAMVAVDR